MRYLLQSLLCIFTSLAAGHPYDPDKSKPGHDAEQYDVVVVGGGMSGLTAAKYLGAAEYSTIVLEARDRVGGRVKNKYLSNGGVQEVGAEFIGPTQDRMYALANELELEIYKTYDTGDLVADFNGERFLGLLGLDEDNLNEFLSTNDALDQMAATIDVQSPWSHPNATEWDSILFSSWLESTVSSPIVMGIQNVIVHGVYSVEPHELSLFYVVSYIASSGNETHPGNMNRLISTTDGGQEARIVGGTQLFAIKLAEQMKRNGIPIVLNSPVYSITKHKSCYIVHSGHKTYSARKVVVAMSPPLADDIKYSPPLPADRTRLMAGMHMGAVGKVVAVYETPFWRNESLSGQALTDVGVARILFDNSPPGAEYGALMSFIEADEMREWDHRPEEELKERVLEDFAALFGPRARDDAKDFVSQRWDLERWSQGGPFALPAPGLLSELGHVLREPADGIHFAGTETADYWVGYMDGAVRSGERVAKEVAAALGGKS